MMALGGVLFLLGVLLVVSLFYSQAGWPAPARESAFALGILLSALGSILWVPGLAMYVLIPSFSKRERALLDYGSHRVVLASTLLAVIVGNLLATLYFLPLALGRILDPSRASARGLMGELVSPEGIAVAAVSLDVALLAVVYLRVVRPGAVTWDSMGLNGHHLAGRLALGLVAGLLLFGASSVVEMLLARLGVQQTQGALFQSVARATPREFGLILLAGAVVAPIVEEIYFRGYVFRAYLDQKGAWRAFLFSSGLFAVVHLDLAALLPIFSMGLLLSFVYYRTGSIVPAIVAHALNNATAFTLLHLGLA